jgi:hypothetical protein
MFQNIGLIPFVPFVRVNNVITQKIPGDPLNLISNVDRPNLLNLSTYLSAPTGDETAFTLNYTTNKSASGNDFGLVINWTDISSPGSSYPLVVFRNNNYLFRILDSGGVETFGASYFNANIYVSNTIYSLGTNSTLILNSRSYSAGGTIGVRVVPSTISNSSGLFVGLQINPAYNQTGTAGATDLLINRIETAIGSGSHNFIDAQINGVSKFKVRRDGLINWITENTTTTVGSAGSAQALPNNPAGYLKVTVNDTVYLVPYYNLS